MLMINNSSASKPKAQKKKERETKIPWHVHPPRKTTYTFLRNFNNPTKNSNFTKL